VGGGIAGCMSAIALLRNGFKVTMLEQREGWAPRVFGSFMNAEAAFSLDYMGLLEPAFQAGAVKVPTVRLVMPDGSGSTISTLQQGHTAITIPRRSLVELLRNAVITAGGTVLMGVRGQRYSRTGNGDWQVDVVPSTASPAVPPSPFLFLADGRYSIGAAGPAKGGGWFGWEANFSGVDQKPGEISMHFFPGGYLGAQTYLNGDSNMGGIIWSPGRSPGRWDDQWAQALARHPGLAELFRNAKRVEDWRGVGPMPYTARMREAGGAIPVGDSAGVNDPFMGEGLGRALAVGPLLDSCLKSFGPADFSHGDLRARFMARWQRGYEPRFRLARPFRYTLRTPLLFNTAGRFLFNSPRLLDSLTPLIHGPRLNA